VRGKEGGELLEERKRGEEGREGLGGRTRGDHPKYESETATGQHVGTCWRASAKDGRQEGGSSGGVAAASDLPAPR